MRNIKVLVILIMLTFLVGCQKSTSELFEVPTGDNIKITLKDSKKYKITTETPFTIKEDNKIVTTGTFINKDGYNDYKKTLDNEEVNVIKTENKNSIEYTYFRFGTETYEYIYLILIKDTNTAVILKNKVSDESAQKVFKNLEFSLNK